ncbi:uncharacterized protein BDZ83DRAFT_615655 [Colletotrichum acutatum]|uniref:Uncharacterized protein n=1 Tax=Glomerella acutata TaxID=27357 RepID=A0AAD8UUP2_GLOAC|nr:uncharacterized protein BDZ83DRAFT_615655 [Colletotrichum acutatum]KAK1726625.1 hypothetical protein BDZ83DRAFT_615655 [Colletotrichum acutatum]
MDHGCAFSIRPGDSIDGREFANAGCRDEGPDALDTSISIGGVSCIQLVGVADPEQPCGFNIVEQ